MAAQHTPRHPSRRRDDAGRRRPQTLSIAARVRARCRGGSVPRSSVPAWDSRGREPEAGTAGTVCALGAHTSVVMCRPPAPTNREGGCRGRIRTGSSVDLSTVINRVESSFGRTRGMSACDRCRPRSHGEKHTHYCVFQMSPPVRRTRSAWKAAGSHDLRRSRPWSVCCPEVVLGLTTCADALILPRWRRVVPRWAVLRGRRGVTMRSERYVGMMPTAA